MAEKLPTPMDGRARPVSGTPAGQPGTVRASRTNGRSNADYRPPAYFDLSDLHRTIVDLWCEGGRDWDEICDSAEKLTGTKLTKSDRRNLELNRQLITVLRGFIRTEVMREGPRLAWETLKEVMEDGDAPPAARIKAAEVALKWSGEVAEAERAALQDPDKKPMAEWTVEELEAYIREYGQSDSPDRILDITPTEKPN